MITIEDYDLPITVAHKIITGVRPSNSTPMVKGIVQGITGVEPDDQTIDMFTLEEIREIATYLLVYCEIHKERGD